jgi:SAM-dependent methyltransferase
LRARAGIYAWQEPVYDFHGIVLDAAPWQTGHRVLDVGCGPGAYLGRLAALGIVGLRLVGVDLSPGMVVEAGVRARSAAFAVADVCRLPFPGSTFDRVLAPHMLYHAPDVDGAVAELRRVLAPDGVALVVTNGEDHLDGFARTVEAATGVGAWMRTFTRFSLETGVPVLSRHFDSVAVTHVRGTLRVPEAEPVVAYVASARSSLEPQLPAALDWDTALERICAHVQAVIDTDGVWVSSTHAGLAVCR